MKISIIGSGRIGGLVGKLWAQAGHQVRFSSRHPENLDALVAESGPIASRSSIEEVLAFGEVVLISIPYGSLQGFGEQYGSQLSGKIMMETGNPYPQRDGDVARRVLDSGLGTGHWSARWLSETRLVRAFNSVWDQTLPARSASDAAAGWCAPGGALSNSTACSAAQRKIRSLFEARSKQQEVASRTTRKCTRKPLVTAGAFRLLPTSA
jgi:predicted dinucleotide-binding enzyme